MPTITFLPSGIQENVENGITVIEAAKQARLVIETPCNCIGTCRKCKVEIDGLKKLACQTRVEGDMLVIIPEGSDSSTMKIVADGISSSVILNPAVTKEYNLPSNRTTVRFDGIAVDEESGDTAKDTFGIVIDIGTTTVVASLLDLSSGNEVNSTSRLNRQALHAQDVLSRIKFSHAQDGLEIMYREIIIQIDEMINELADNNQIDINRIYEIVFSGNTCMLHLATRTDPTSLGKYPYNPKIHGDSYEPATGHHLSAAISARVYLPPIISSYVGADITSGILASGLTERSGRVLFVDIGTNGEVVLSNNGVLSATSTAAGPAFEGMNISCGMRAEKGAIEVFSIDDNGLASISTIDDDLPRGICGSGLFDVVGELVKHGILTPSGRFIDPLKVQHKITGIERLVRREGKLVYHIIDNIYLTQEDVRQVQLAKGAIRAGIEMLLADSGLTPAGLDQVLIAGSFGYHLREENLINVGLLPLECKGKVSFLGNTSKSGGVILLMDKFNRGKVSVIVDTVRVLSLTDLDGFDRVFAKSLGF